MPNLRRALPLTALLLLALGAARPVAALDPDKAFHHYVSNTWSIEEGLPQISAMAITQDRQGYVWVGTQAGLARFDGIRFSTYNPENTPGLRGIWIHDLHVDKQDRLWIATYRGLSVRDEHGFHPIPLAGPDPLRSLDTQDIVAMPSGELMVAAPDGVYRASDEALELAYPLPRPATVLLARGDELWVGSLGRVFRIAGGVVELLPLPDTDADTVVTQLIQSQGRLWAGTSAGLFYREGDQWQRHEGGEPLSRVPIEVMAEDRDGNLWVGMVEHLARLRAGRVQELIIDGRAASAVRAVYEDREGNLWMGSQWEGLSRLWNGWTRRYGHHEGLDDPVLWSVAQGRDGQLWVGTNSGLSVLRDGRFEQVVAGARLPHPNAYTLLPEDGAVWIGTRRGVAVLRDERLELPPELAPMRSAQINAILRDHRGALWFATTQGLFRQSRGELRRFGTEDGLRDPRSRVLHETRDGRLLLGSQTGLYEVVGDRVEPLGLDAGLPAELDVTAIHELKTGELVIGALSEEIFLFYDKRWTRFGADQGMPVNSAFFITEDTRGFLWVAGIRGILRVPLGDLREMAAGRGKRVRGEMLLNERGDRRGGQKGYCCNGAGNAKGFLRDGELWLPSRDGLVAMATHGVVKNTVAPRTLIERVKVGEQWRDADASADWHLPQQARDLSFEFTALSFQDPNSVDLRYRLLGYDADWRTLEDGSRRVVNYTNLPPGPYVFEALGANNAGLWSDAPAQLGFRIQPSFHETGLFRLLLAVLAASIVYAGFVQQRGAHRRQREALEQLVRQRTEALEVANLRLEDASQTDPLTGLRNRRYLANQIPADIAFYDRETLRRGSPGEVMVFALIDIDHFKAVNDTHGHQAGDRVLQQFAAVLGQLVRTGDYIARWGARNSWWCSGPCPTGTCRCWANASAPPSPGTGSKSAPASRCT